MDLFARGSGLASVLGFAGRVFLTIGKARATAKPDNLPLWDTEPRDVWLLSMIVVQWYSGQLPAEEATAVGSAFAGSKIGTLAGALSLFDEKLRPFAKAAHEAKTLADLDGAAVYFNAALDGIGLSTISRAIKSGPVADVSAELLPKYPLDSELASAYLGRAVPKKPTTETLPTVNGKATPSATGSPTKPSRSERFDRADRIMRLPEVPKLAPDERMVAHLYTKGWSPEQIEEIRKGPKGKA